MRRYGEFITKIKHTVITFKTFNLVNHCKNLEEKHDPTGVHYIPSHLYVTSDWRGDIVSTGSQVNVAVQL